MPEKPLAFISYTNVDPDGQVACELDEAFSSAGFEVWAMHQTWRTIGQSWRDVYESELPRAQVMVAVVSAHYLSKPECLNEVSIAHGQFINDRILLYPIFLEPLSTAGLSKKAVLRLGQLTLAVGRNDGRRPTKAEIVQDAADLFAKATDNAVPASGADGAPPVVPHPKPVDVTGLYTVSTRGDEVHVQLSRTDRRARKIASVLMSRHKMRPDQAGCWRMTRAQFEGAFMETVTQVAQDG